MWNIIEQKKRKDSLLDEVLLFLWAKAINILLKTLRDFDDVLALPGLTVHNGSHLLCQGQTMLFLSIRKVQTASLSNR